MLKSDSSVVIWQDFSLLLVCRVGNFLYTKEFSHAMELFFVLTIRNAMELNSVLHYRIQLFYENIFLVYSFNFQYYCFLEMIFVE